MTHGLQDISLIDPAARQKLAAAGILTGEQLLARAALPRQRARLAAELALDEDALLQWTAVAELMRVKGVGPKLAQLLVQLPGMRTVGDLAVAAPEALRSRLVAHNDGARILRQVPAAGALAGCISAAGDLRPRLVLAAARAVDFRQVVAAHDLEQQRQHRQLVKLLALFILSMAAAAALILFQIIRGGLIQWRVAQPALSQLMPAAEQALLWFTWLPTTVFLTLGLGGVSALAFWIWRLESRFIQESIRYRLFDRPLYQHYYLHQLKSTQLARYEQAIRRAALFLALFGAIGIYLATTETLSYRLLLAISPPVVGAIALYPDLAGVWRARQTASHLPVTAVQRYLMYRLLFWIGLLLWIWLLLQVLLPAAFGAYRLAAGRWIVPAFESRIGAMTAEAAETAVASEADAASKQAFLERFRPERTAVYAAFIRLQDADGTRWEAETIAMLGPPIIWIAILVIVGFVIIPFILLGRWQQALLFFGIALLSEGVEQVLTARAPAAFPIPRGSLVAFLLVVGLLLANTLLFDWFYQASTERHKPCIRCGRELADEDRYCSACGSPQPEAGLG